MPRRTLQRAVILGTLVLALSASSALASDETGGAPSAAAACTVDAQFPIPMGPLGQACGPLSAPAASPCPPGTVPCGTPAMAAPMAQPMMGAPLAQPPMGGAMSPPGAVMGQGMPPPSPYQDTIFPNGTGGMRIGYGASPPRLIDPNPLWPVELCSPSWCYQWDIWSRPGVSPFAIGGFAVPLAPVAFPATPTWQPAQVCGCPWPQ